MTDEMRKFIRDGLIMEMGRQNYADATYITPKFNPLTQAQIDEIHRRGRITPQEMVEEWEAFGLCAPGDSGSNERCHNFKNCHDCLVDYANMKDDYSSIIAFAHNFVSPSLFSEDEIKQMIGGPVLTKHK